MSDIKAIYSRIIPFARTMPMIVAIPFIAESAQHLVEWNGGFYAANPADAAADPARLAMGAIKVAAILVVIVVALRWWRFGTAASEQPLSVAFKGFVVATFVLLAGSLVAFGAGALISRLFGPDTPRALRLGISLLPVIAWQLTSVMLTPWYVGRITVDRAMTMRHSVNALRPVLGRAVVMFLLGYLPLLAVHYALGYGAMGRPFPVAVALLLVDAACVSLLAVTIASLWFGLYRLAAPAR